VLCLAAAVMIGAGLCLFAPSSIVDTGGIGAAGSRLIVLAHGLLAVYGILGGLLMNLLRVGGQLPRQLACGLVERVALLSTPILAACLGGGPPLASWITVAVIGAVDAMLLREVFRRTPVPISPSAGSLREGFQLAAPGLLFFAAALSPQLLFTGITLIVSRAAGAAAVVTFATALMLTNLFRLILNQAVNVLSSEVTLLLASEDLPRLRHWYCILWKAGTAAAVAASIVICAAGPPLISLWTGGAVRVDFQLNVLLCGYLAVQAAGILSAGFGLAMNRQREVFVVQLAAGLAALLCCAVSIRKFGLPAAAASLLCAQTLGTAALTALSGRWLDFRPAPLLRRGFPTLAFAVAAIWFARSMNSAVSPLAVPVSLAACLSLAWFTWLDAGERHWLRDSLRPLVHRPAALAASS
jgi:O-antigen/teichoic acid export membrane protein